MRRTVPKSGSENALRLPVTCIDLHGFRVEGLGFRVKNDKKDGSQFIVSSLGSGVGNGAIGYVNHYGDCMGGRPNYGSFVGILNGRAVRY